MSVFEYVDIPLCATPLTSEFSLSNSGLRAVHKVSTPLPKSEQPESSNLSSPRPQSPSSVKTSFNITSVLVSSGLHVPSPSAASPRWAPYLLSTRDALSLPTTTSNFRRFVAKSGPIFWMQDRLEEILLWRKGWKYTTAWIIGYTLLCYFPRLILLIPNVIIASIVLTAYSWRHKVQSNSSEVENPPVVTTPVEGSKEWFSNMQAIQNLMGFIADVYDVAMSFLPILTFSSPYTYTLIAVLVASTLLMVPIICIIPLRPVFTILGVLPFAFTHPQSSHYLLNIMKPYRKRVRMRLQRFVDNDRLEDWHWLSPLEEVELWENERYAPNVGWSKQNLRPEERRAWTRGRDGWSETRADGTGNVTNLTFSLSPGWAFVETEDWRRDLEATWTDVPSDDEGWIYTNDAWQEPQSAPSAECVNKGFTRRRRWTRRIFYDQALLNTP